MGHGTAIVTAEKILTEGLRVFERAQPILYDSAVPLFDTSKSYDEQPDEIFQMLLNWPHKVRGSGAVVIIMIPNPPQEAVGGRQYFDAVFEPVSETDDGRTEYRINPRYIRGYINTQTRRFISNPRFDPKMLEIKLKEAEIPDVIILPIEQQVEPKEKSSEDSDIW